QRERESDRARFQYPVEPRSGIGDAGALCRHSTTLSARRARRGFKKMNFHSRVIRFVLILNLAATFFASVAFGADNAAAVAPTGRAEETNSADMLRAYLQLQEQVHATQLAIERNRQEADELAGRAAEGLNGRLKAIEESLTAQRSGELQAVQA